MNQINTIINSVTDEIVQRVMGAAPAEQKSEYKAYFGKLFMARMGAVVFEALPEADRATYQSMFIEQRPPAEDAALTFLREHLPNLEEVMSQEAVSFIDECTASATA